jgi:hypothetical protein
VAVRCAGWLINSISDCRFSGRDLNMEPLDNKAGVLSTRLWCSLTFTWKRSVCPKVRYRFVCLVCTNISDETYDRVSGSGSLQPQGSRRRLVPKCWYSPTKPQRAVVRHEGVLPCSWPMLCCRYALYSVSRCHKLFTALLSLCMCTVFRSHVGYAEEMLTGLEIIDCSV